MLELRKHRDPGLQFSNRDSIEASSRMSFVNSLRMVPKGRRKSPSVDAVADMMVQNRSKQNPARNDNFRSKFLDSNNESFNEIQYLLQKLIIAVLAYPLLLGDREICT